MDQYAVLGNPIHHSLSPTIHRLFAKATHQQLTYSAILVPLGKLAETLTQFQNNGGKGVNITLPFKEEAYSLVDRLSPRAITAKAINTIQFTEDGQRFGDNTDGVGLINDLLHNQKLTLHHKRLLIIGAGGAVKGILSPLLAEKPESITIANRTESKAAEIAASFLNQGTYTTSLTLLTNEKPFDLIIHATSAGLHQEKIELPTAILNESTFCYDLSYQKETPFLVWAKENGVKSFANGLGMLVEQAAEAFWIWRGIRPETKQIIEAGMTSLKKIKVFFG